MRTENKLTQKTKKTTFCIFASNEQKLKILLGMASIFETKHDASGYGNSSDINFYVDFLDLITKGTRDQTPIIKVTFITRKFMAFI